MVKKFANLAYKVHLEKYMFRKTLQPLFGFLGIEGLQFEIQIDCLANLTGWLSTSPVVLVH